MGEVSLPIEQGNRSTPAGMKTDVQDSTPEAGKKIARRLRKIGAAVLFLAVVSASVVYWVGKRAEERFEDPSMGGFNKASQRQMEMMYGKMGTITEDLFQHLKQPGTQGAIILIGGTLIAAGCFYFARLASYGDAPEVSRPVEGGRD